MVRPDDQQPAMFILKGIAFIASTLFVCYMKQKVIETLRKMVSIFSTWACQGSTSGDVSVWRFGSSDSDPDVVSLPGNPDAPWKIRSRFFHEAALTRY